MKWNPTDVSPPPGLIICKVPWGYVECMVKDVGENRILMSEEPMEWGEVTEWVAVPPDFYGFDGECVRHERY